MPWKMQQELPGSLDDTVELIPMALGVNDTWHFPVWRHRDSGAVCYSG